MRLCSRSLMCPPMHLGAIVKPIQSLSIRHRLSGILIVALAALWLGLPVAAAESQAPDRSNQGRELLDKAVSAIGDPTRFDGMESIRFKGLSFSAENPDYKTPVDMLTPLPEEGTGLWMHIVSEGEDRQFDRRVAGDRSWAKGLGELPAELHAGTDSLASSRERMVSAPVARSMVTMSPATLAPSSMLSARDAALWVRFSITCRSSA